MPSLFSTEISHSIPVPQSITFRIGTLALKIGKTPQQIPSPEIENILFLDDRSDNTMIQIYSIVLYESHFPPFRYLRNSTNYEQFRNSHNWCVGVTIITGWGHGKV
jgi:hypothetical protein